MISLALALALAVQARDTVTVLVSENLPEYEAPIQSFNAELGRPTQVMQIDGDRVRANRLARELREDPPPLIFALGAKAAYVAVHEIPNVPVIFAMVMDPERYGIDGAFISGVTMEVPPDMVLAQFQLFAPSVKRLGILLGTDNDRASVRDAIAAAREAGYEVHARRVGSSKDVRRAFNRMIPGVDAVWLLPDATVLTPTNFHYIRNAAAQAHLPLLAWSELLVQAGALMCVAPDYDRTGAQAAQLAREVLTGTNAGTIPLQAPDAPRVVINRDVQQAIGLKLDDVMLDFVDEVVARPTER